MNILPKKNWHVRRKENVERVRRDEAEAKAKEEELKRRAEIADREAKIELMKKRARKRDGVCSDEEQSDKMSSSQAPTNINLFSDLEQGVGVQLTNAEHDAEKKAEQEKVEKRIGLLNYLVDKDKSEEPWYSQKKGTEESAKLKQRKEAMDPMNQMNDYLRKKRKVDTLQEQLQKQATSHMSAPPLTIASSKSKPPKGEVHTSESRLHQTHKHKHKKHKKHKQKLRESVSAEKKSHLEKLREERRKREETERTRSETMLKKFYAGGGNSDTSHETASSVVEKPGRYFSQFNPHLARQHRTDQ